MKAYYENKIDELKKGFGEEMDRIALMVTARQKKAKRELMVIKFAMGVLAAIVCFLICYATL